MFIYLYITHYIFLSIRNFISTCYNSSSQLKGKAKWVRIKTMGSKQGLRKQLHSIFIPKTSFTVVCKQAGHHALLVPAHSCDLIRCTIPLISLSINTLIVMYWEQDYRSKAAWSERHKTPKYPYKSVKIRIEELRKEMKEAFGF